MLYPLSYERLRLEDTPKDFGWACHNRGMPNRLAQSMSPYLRQHQDNPVDWYEWGVEAFAKAKAEDKAIFLSIGYSSCHWCHVMAHETFEDPAIGEFLNEHFVSIKVDREERPDVDEAYMLAVQMIAGRGGWPMTIFMTPDRKPFFAGTYFPRQDRGKVPGFATLATQIATLWRRSRPDVLKSADQISEAIGKALGRTMSSLTSTIEPSLFTDCFNALRADFDGENGGFGPAPKFPPAPALLFLLDYASTAPDATSEALSMVLLTLERMALGGIHDQIGGGFHRYSTDSEWRLPHFEKMLIDNGLLLQVYARAAQLAGEMNAPVAGLLEQTTIGIIEWLKREMVTAEGLFCSAQDADTMGEEGLYYLWSVDEIKVALGQDATAFIEAFGIEENGNFLDEATQQLTGLNLLYLAEDRREEFRLQLRTLLEARQTRPAPQLDNKAIAAWNGAVIRGLVAADELLIAEAAMRRWMMHVETHGALPHQVTDGTPSGEAYLDDVAHMALAAIELGRAIGEPAYQGFGKHLIQHMITEFEDRVKGGFYFTNGSHDDLFGRSKPVMDQAVPSPNAVAIEACLAYGEREVAERALMAVVGIAQKMPQAAESMVRVAMMMEHSKTVSGPILESSEKKVLGKVTAVLRDREVRGTGAVILNIPEGLHLNTNDPPARWLTPTQLRFQGIEPEVRYPKGADDQFTGTVEIEFSGNATTSTEFQVTVQFQACTDTECLAPDDIVLDGVLLPA